MGLDRRCAHGVPLDADCGSCIESYGSNRVLPAQPRMSVPKQTSDLRWNNKTGRLEQKWVGNGGAGADDWRPVPCVDG